MAENKTKPTGADPAELIAAIPDSERRRDCEAVWSSMQTCSLGSASTRLGRGACTSIKRMSDVDEEVHRELIARSAASV